MTSEYWYCTVQYSTCKWYCTCRIGGSGASYLLQYPYPPILHLLPATAVQYCCTATVPYRHTPVAAVYAYNEGKEGLKPSVKLFATTGSCSLHYHTDTTTDRLPVGFLVLYKLPATLFRGLNSRSFRTAPAPGLLTQLPIGVFVLYELPPTFRGLDSRSGLC